MNTTKKIFRKLAFLLAVVFNNVASSFALAIHLMPAAYCLLPCAFCLLTFTVNAQLPSAPTTMTEQQLEAITENNADAEIEDDSFIQSMRHFLKNPVNLNEADIVTLKEMMIFSPLQIQHIIDYRKLLGNFISIYELQAVPGLDLPLIEKIRPYITVSDAQPAMTSIAKRFKNGSSALLVRVSTVLEKQKGFTHGPATTGNYYLGSNQKLLIRYKYQYKNLLQYGMVGEKDAGEQFFRGAQKYGFDFYGVHLFVRNIGIIKSLALGDFTVNMGQGLVQWQSLAFRKSVDVPNIKRQLAVLRPYSSAGEINFHRGIGITVAKRKLESTVFISRKKIDANFITDTANNEAYVSSLQTSGLHRTYSEIADKGIQQQFIVGTNIGYNSNRVHLGVNGVQYHFKLPIKKSVEPYNLYAIAGNAFGNYSMDYSYAFRNCHFFGEAAITNHFDKAFVNGFIASIDSKIDVSIVYRNISKKYQSLYTNAFTESGYPNNEKGLYTGVSIRPNGFWRIDAYVDFYEFPWLKYGVNVPAAGKDFLVQATYRPNKKLDMFIRWHTESKAKNDNPNELTFSQVTAKQKQQVRTQFNLKLNSFVSIRHRVEMLWFDKRGLGAENGFLTYVDFLLKPLMKPFSGSIRLQYFETEGYNSRLYAYENDLLYSFSIPVFYDKGARYYVNINYDMSKKITVWLRWAQTVYHGKASIGSGLDEIAGNRRTELKIQVQYLF